MCAWRCVVLAIAVAMGVLTPAAADDEPQTVLSPYEEGELTRVEVAPGQSHVVVLIPETEQRGRAHALYAVPLRGDDRTPVRLHPLPFEGATVERFAITPDARHVVFQASLTTPGVRELYARRLDGSGELVRLDVPLAGHDGVGVRGFEVAPDGTRVVYRADFGHRATFDLWSRAVDASGPQVRLTDAADGSLGVVAYEVDATSQRVAYVGPLEESGRRELFSRPIDGSSPAVLLSEVGPGGDVLDLEVTPDGSTVVYRGDLVADGVVDLYASPIDTAAQRRLTRPDGGSGLVARWQLTPDGRSAVVLAHLRSDLNELFTVPLDGSGPPVLVAPAGPGDAQVLQYVVAPDGERVAWTFHDAPRTTLWSAPVAGDAAPVRLDAPGHASSGVTWLVVTPDGDRVVYAGDLVTDGVLSLHSRRIDGRGSQVRLDTTTRPGGSTSVGLMVVAPDGTRVAYTGQLGDDDTFHAASRAIDGSGPQVLLSPTGAGGAYGPVLGFTPDSAAVLFVGSRDGQPRSLFASGHGRRPPPRVAAPARSDVAVDAATIAWAPTVASGVDRYEVSLEPPTILPVVVDTASASVRLEGLEPDTPYVASVVAVNAAGRSAPREVRFTTATAGAGSATRLAGDDRDATAAAIALDAFSTADVTTVFLTTGRDFPDALAGGPLAALGGSPILLVGPRGLSEATLDALAELAPDRVVALGGPSVVSDAVLAAAARASGPATTTARLSGDDRHATAAAVARELAPAELVYLATGRNFPDALAASGVTRGAPILLTEPTSLPAATRDALAALRPRTIVALGGPSAVADDVLARARLFAGATTTRRLAGDDRFATAAAIADLVPAPTIVYVATGRSFPDALAGAPAAAAASAPLVLVEHDGVPTATASWLRANRRTIERLVVLGGPGAIAAEVVAELHALVS